MSAATSEVHDVAEARLRRVRQRYTDGRRALVGVLLAARRPLATPEIMAAGEPLPQSSVYRNLQVLEVAGVVRRVHGGTEAGARYELDEELTAHHHHLICHVCGSVTDFHPSRPVELALERAAREARERGDFAADHHRLDLVGTCAACA